MKKTLKIVLNWMLFWIWFMLILGVSYLAIKARQTANPWLTEGAPTGGLYVGANETLSAAKRNVLVKRWTREDVATTDTANFDTNCDRKFISNNVLRTPIAVNTTRINTLSNNANSRYINSSNKTKNINALDTNSYYTVTNLRKRCQ